MYTDDIFICTDDVLGGIQCPLLLKTYVVVHLWGLLWGHQYLRENLRRKSYPTIISPAQSLSPFACPVYGWSLWYLRRCPGIRRKWVEGWVVSKVPLQFATPFYIWPSTIGHRWFFGHMNHLPQTWGGVSFRKSWWPKDMKNFLSPRSHDGNRRTL